MSDTYKTITSLSQGIYKEKGSKFLSFAIPVHDIDEIKELLKSYRKEYYDARHVCYAYMLGAERKIWRANDDGEPSGTAGRPILGQLNSNELTNILVVVVRYFGGILLGTGGLITAYKEATSDALREAEIIEKTVDCYFIVHFEYPHMNEVMHLVKETNALVHAQSYDTDCNMEISIRKQESDFLIGKMEKIDDLKIEFLEER